MSKCGCTLLWVDAISEICQVPSAHWGVFLNSVFPKSFHFSILDWLSVSGSSFLFASQKTSASPYASTSQVSSQSHSDEEGCFPRREGLSKWSVHARQDRCIQESHCPMTLIPSTCSPPFFLFSFSSSFLLSPFLSSRSLYVVWAVTKLVISYLFRCHPSKTWCC